jgi:urease accessory protein
MPGPAADRAIIMTREGTVLSESQLLRLMTWLSPAFPVGGYTYSHGIEYAVEAGLVGDRVSLAEWVSGILLHGSGGVDATLAGLAWEAVATDDDGELARIAEYAEAFRGTAEMALESMAQGRAFLDAVRRAWPHPRFDHWVGELAASGRPPAYPVAVGVAAAVAGIPRDLAVTAYLHAFSANLVSAGVRLVPLGQSDGLAAMAALEPPVRKSARDALSRSLDEIGAATLMVDWTSMQHETQYTRLYRS